MLLRMDRKPTLHIVDRSSRIRAELARIAFGLGHHAEVYADLDELTARPPQDGIVLLRDEGEQGGVALRLERLWQSEVWLPVLVTDLQPRTSQVVEAIKAGALEYLVLPIEADRLRRVLAQVTDEAAAHAEARRRMIEARASIARLSGREREVLDWLCCGYSNKAIARELSISPRTVEIHRANMMAKLGANHPADAVRLQLDAKAVSGRSRANG